MNPVAAAARARRRCTNSTSVPTAAPGSRWNTSAPARSEPFARELRADSRLRVASRHSRDGSAWRPRARRLRIRPHRRRRASLHGQVERQRPRPRGRPRDRTNDGQRRTLATRSPCCSPTTRRMPTSSWSATFPSPSRSSWTSPLRDAVNMLEVGCRPPEPDGGVERAAAAAARADAVILMVGTGDDIEREGADRTTLQLPGRQEELGRRVIAANPRTIAIVNAGVGRRPALGARRSRAALHVVSRRGARTRARRRALRRPRARRPIADHARRVRRRLPRARHLTGPGPSATVRGVDPRRLPPLRRPPDRAGVLLRPRARLHRLHLRGDDALALDDRRRRTADRRRDGAQYRTTPRQGGRAALRRAADQRPDTRAPRSSSASRPSTWVRARSARSNSSSTSVPSRIGTPRPAPGRSFRARTSCRPAGRRATSDCASAFRSEPGVIGGSTIRR